MLGENYKVLYIGTFLKGNAFNQFKLMLYDYYDKPEEVQQDVTKEMFSSYRSFVNKLRIIYRDADEQTESVKKLYKLK